MKNRELTHIEFDDEEQVWHLFIDFERGSTFPCPLCGQACKAYDAEVKKWRHLDFWDWKTYMHARVPRTSWHDESARIRQATPKCSISC